MMFALLSWMGVAAAACPADAPEIEVAPILRQIASLPRGVEPLVSSLYTLGWLAEDPGCIDGDALITLAGAGNPFGIGSLDTRAEPLIRLVEEVYSEPEKRSRILVFDLGKLRFMHGSLFAAPDIEQLVAERYVRLEFPLSTSSAYGRALSESPGQTEPNGELGGVPDPLVIGISGITLKMVDGAVIRPTRLVVDPAAMTDRVWLLTRGRQRSWAPFEL